MIEYTSETKEQRSARISDIMTRAKKLLRKIPLAKCSTFPLTPEELQLLEDRNTIVCGSLKKYNKELHEEQPHLVSLMEQPMSTFKDLDPATKFEGFTNVQGPDGSLPPTGIAVEFIPIHGLFRTIGRTALLGSMSSPFNTDHGNCGTVFVEVPLDKDPQDFLSVYHPSRILCWRELTSKQPLTIVE